jgi:hypothetical protein
VAACLVRGRAAGAGRPQRAAGAHAPQRTGHARPSAVLVRRGRTRRRWPARRRYCSGRTSTCTSASWRSSAGLRRSRSTSALGLKAACSRWRQGWATGWCRRCRRGSTAAAVRPAVGAYLDVPLYWHRWRYGGELLDALAAHLGRAAGAWLEA